MAHCGVRQPRGVRFSPGPSTPRSALCIALDVAGSRKEGALTGGEPSRAVCPFELEVHLQLVCGGLSEYLVTDRRHPGGGDTLGQT